MQAITLNIQYILKSLVDIALYHGHASFKVKGDYLVKRLECCGMSIDFINKQPIRIRARNLDLNINYTDSSAPNPADFLYAQGNDFVLNSLYKDIEYLNPTTAQLAHAA